MKNKSIVVADGDDGSDACGAQKVVTLALFCHFLKAFGTKNMCKNRWMFVALCKPKMKHVFTTLGPLVKKI